MCHQLPDSYRSIWQFWQEFPDWIFKFQLTPVCQNHDAGTDKLFGDGSQVKSGVGSKRLLRTEVGNRIGVLENCAAILSIEHRAIKAFGGIYVIQQAVH